MEPHGVPLRLALAIPVHAEPRHRRLNIRSSPELDALVEQAQQTINGVEPQTLRDSNRLRQMVARDFEQIQAAVGGLLVDRPRRNILRRGGLGGAA